MFSEARIDLGKSAIDKEVVEKVSWMLVPWFATLIEFNAIIKHFLQV